MYYNINYNIHLSYYSANTAKLRPTRGVLGNVCCDASNGKPPMDKKNVWWSKPVLTWSNDNNNINKDIKRKIDKFGVRWPTMFLTAVKNLKVSHIFIVCAVCILCTKLVPHGWSHEKENHTQLRCFWKLIFSN